MTDERADELGASTLDVQDGMVRDPNDELMVVGHETNVVVDIPTCHAEREHEGGDSGRLGTCEPQGTTVIPWNLKPAQQDLANDCGRPPRHRRSHEASLPVRPLSGHALDP